MNNLEPRPDFDIRKMVAQPGSWQMIRAMGGIGVFCALLIIFVYQITLPIIEKNRAEYLEKSIFNVLPGATSKVTYTITPQNTLERVAANEGAGKRVYAGYDQNGELVGVAIEARGMGFQDVIVMLYGYSPQKDAIIGIQVLESKETPGLGDKVETDPQFLKNFHALDVSLTEDGSAPKNPIEMVKSGEKEHPWQIEAITGATITSRAVSNILRESSAEYVPVLKKNLDQLTKPETS